MVPPLMLHSKFLNSPHSEAFQALKSEIERVVGGWKYLTSTLASKCCVATGYIEIVYC
jgi:hypothetical protein